MGSYNNEINSEQTQLRRYADADPVNINMAASKQDQEFVQHVIDLMQLFGPAHAKSMFGGYGIYLDGIMFALIADRTLYLKADQSTITEFSAQGLEPFTYYKKGQETKMSYYQAPEETLENPEVMATWCNKAFSVARAAACKRQRK